METAYLFHFPPVKNVKKTVLTLALLEVNIRSINAKHNVCWYLNVEDSTSNLCQKYTGCFQRRQKHSTLNYIFDQRIRE